MSARQAPGGVVLATRPLGEADLLVVALTATHGKILAAARHARRSTRRFAGGLGVGATGVLELVPKPAGLWRLDGLVRQLDHSSLGRDLNRFAYVAYLCELTDSLLHEHQHEPHIFADLVHALTQTTREAPDPLVLRRYELGLLLHLGHLPVLTRCCVCGAPLERSSTPFDPRRGGPLCGVHGVGAPHTPARLWSAAQQLLQDPTTANLDLDLDLRRRLRDFTAAALGPHLQRPLRSVEFFAQIAAATRHDAPA